MRSDSRLLAAGMRDYRSGRLRRAERACHEVLRRSPEQPDALHLLAMVLADSGNPDLATALLARAIHRCGPTAPFCLTLGAVLRQRGDLAGSSACFLQALATDPCCAEALYQHGVNFVIEGRVHEAVRSFSAALRVDPGHHAACARLADILRALARPADAISGYEAALRLKPDDADTLLQHARALVVLDRLDEAVAAYGDVLPRWPRSADVRSEFGVVLRSLGRHDDARRLYRDAIALDPEHADAHWNLAVLDLLSGDFAAGWRGYEWRFRQPGRMPPPPPVWDGAPLHGAAILLHAEQGFGDAIQFVRYASLVSARGGRVTLACRPELWTLFAAADGVAAVASPDAAPENIACHAALMSLPRILGHMLETIPAHVPYVSVDAKRVEEWRILLGSSPGVKRIGVAWAGSKDHANDRHRSLPPAELLPLGDLPRVKWYSLQKDEAAPPFPISPLPRRLTDFADEAALHMNLDLILTVDTAAAHLAGALARPVWTMLPFAPDWRWLLDRDDTPWYPTMRLFRQSARGDWRGVIERVKAQLAVTP